jgi:Ca2+-binding RTX toxin-like protein
MRRKDTRTDAPPSDPIGFLGGPGDDWVKGGDNRDTVKGDNGNDTLTGGSGRNVIRAGDGMKDLIVCGNNSRNLGYYDPDLDRFDNCVFEKSESSKERSSGGLSATAIAFGPGREAK